MTSLQIHASSLDSYLDCNRFGVAKSFPNLLKQAGYEVKDTKQYITPFVGNGVHAGADFLNQDYIKTGELPSDDLIAAAQAQGYDKFRSLLLWKMETSEVFYPKSKFQTNDIIREHINLYVSIYAKDILPTRKLELTEQKFKVKLNDNFEYVSTLDSAGYGTLYDLKTGDMKTSYRAQIGTYVYLLSTIGFQVNNAQLDFIRHPKEGADPVHEVVRYGADECLALAKYTTARLMSDLTEFQKSGDINVLLYNAKSESCNPVFCPLWGTGSCAGWRNNE